MYDFSIAIFVINALNILNVFGMYNFIEGNNDERNGEDKCNVYDCGFCKIKFNCCECV